LSEHQLITSVASRLAPQSSLSARLSLQALNASNCIVKYDQDAYQEKRCTS
jgi:hypothetical protein